MHNKAYPFDIQEMSRGETCLRGKISQILRPGFRDVSISIFEALPIRQ